MSAKLQPLVRGPSPAAPGDALQSVIEALSRLRYGAIQLTVHDGRLVQVDITERRRFP
jgi:hypothetical protein